MLTVRPEELPIDRAEALHYLGYKPGKRKTGGKILRLLEEEIERACSLIRPRGLFTVIDALPLKEHKFFHDAQKIVFGVCTIGEKLEKEVKRFFKSGECTRGVLLDAVGSVAAEAITNMVNAEAEKWASARNLNITRRFSPGYSGWSVRDQELVFKYLGESTGGVQLTPSGMMVPLKSVSFACKLSTEQMEEVNKGDKCASCNLRGHCAYSRDGVCRRTAREA